MKKWFVLVIMLALVALFMVMGWSVRAQSSSRWEYQVISTYGTSSINPSPNMHQLNEAGAAGWELITIRSEEYPKPGSNQFKTDYFLKRAK